MQYLDDWFKTGLALLFCSSLVAQTTIDFDTTVTGINQGPFSGSGFTPSPTTGQLNSDAWAVSGFNSNNVAFGATETTGDMARGTSTGGVSTGGIYAFETSPGNHSLGVQPVGSDFTPGEIILRIQNTTGQTATGLSLSYIVYVLNNEGRANSFNFSYSTDSVNYTNLSALDLTSAEIADPSPTWQANSRSSTLSSLVINNGDYLYLRWTGDDVSGGGSRDEFALDDISFTWQTGNAAPLITNITRSPAGRVESTQSVTVSAHVTDGDGLSSVTLNWGLSSGNLSNAINMNLQSGNTYQAVIPAQADGLTVFYEIVATDANTTPLTATSAELDYTVSDPKFVPYFQNFDAVDGWQTTSAWEIGQLHNPSTLPGAPDTAYSPSNLAATGVGGNYGNSLDEEYLTSPLISLSGTSNPRISFWMSLNCEAFNDGGILQVSPDEGQTWISVDAQDRALGGRPPNYTNRLGFTFSEGGWSGLIPPSEDWTEVWLDLFNLSTTGLDTLTSNGVVQIRFWFESNGSTNGPGWYLDDFAVNDLLEQPASFSAAAINAGQIDLTTTANTAGDDVVIVANTTGIFRQPNGTPQLGQSLAGGEVVYIGPAGTASHTGLLSSTTYYYSAFSYDANTQSYSTDVTDQDTTDPIAGPVLGATVNYTHEGFTITWEATPGANAYLVQVGFTTFSTTAGSGVVASDLYIAKYAEATDGSNDAFLIYNATGASVNLDDYRFRTFNSNQNSFLDVASNTINLVGTLPADSSYLISESNNNYTSLIGQVDAVLTTGVSGDDVVVLEKETTPGNWTQIDLIGNLPLPGTAWPVAGIAGATENRILSRKATITGPNANPWSTSGSTIASQGTTLLNSEWTVGPSATDANYSGIRSFTNNVYNDFVSTPYADTLILSDTSHYVTFPLAQADSMYFFRVAAINTVNSEKSAYSAYDSATTWFGLSGAWSNPGSWADGTGLPTATDGVYVYGNSTVDANYTSDSLTVDTNAVLDLPANIRLDLGGELIVHGTLNLDSNAALTLTDRPLVNNGTVNLGSTAMLVQGGSQNENSGSGVYNVSRYVQAADHRRFNYWSSPVSNTSLNQVFFDNAAQRTNPLDWFAFSQDTAQIYLALGTSKTNPATVPMQVGEGYAITPTEQTVPAQYLDPVNDLRTFSGTVNNGPINLSFGPLDGDQFMLLGNPYPGPLNLSTFISANPDLDGTVYFWDHTSTTGFQTPVPNNSNADFASWNNMGTTNATGGGMPDDFLQSCQGFLAAVVNGAPANSTVNVNFNNSMRVVASNQQFFKNDAQRETRQRVWLSLSSNLGYYNQTLVGLVPGATLGRDRLWDGRKYKGHSFLSFYSQIDGNPYSIQGLPGFWKADQELIVPLGVDAWHKGHYRIQLDSLNNWPGNYGVYLWDSAQNWLTDLRARDFYFFVDSLQSFQNRFYLKLTNSRLNIGQAEAASAPQEWWAYQQQDKLKLQLPEGTVGRQFTVFNLWGQPVFSTQETFQKNLTITGSWPAGVYLLELQDATGTKSVQKIYWSRY